MKTQRIIAFLLTIMVAFSVTACSGGNENANESESQDSGNFTKSGIELPDYNVTNNKVKILTWTDPSGLKNPNLWIYSFNEKLKSEYNCEMDIIYTTEADSAVKASQLVLSGQSPDLIAYREQSNPNFAVNNLVQPWDEYIDFNEPVYQDVKDINDRYRINGRIYTFITNWVNNGYTYYWTDDLDEIGLESPRDLYYKGEWTWSKVEEYAKLLTQKGTDETITRYGVAYDSNLMHLVTGETLVIKNGNSYKNNIRSAKLAEFFNYTNRLTDVINVFPKQTNANEQFQSHNVSLYIAGRDTLDNRMFEEQLSDQIMFAPSPRWEGTDKYYAPGRLSAMWLAKGAKNVEGALAYVAIWHLLVGNIDEDIEKAVKKLAVATKGHTEKDYELLDEMNNPEKFELITAHDQGLGVNWSNNQRKALINEAVNWNKSWAASVEQYAPLLDAAIKETQDAIAKLK